MLGPRQFMHVHLYGSANAVALRGAQLDADCHPNVQPSRGGESYGERSEHDCGSHIEDYLAIQMGFFGP